MLVMWLLFIVALASAAFLSGATVGLAARARHWPRQRLYLLGYFGCLVLVILGGVIQVVWHLPYPPRFLADSGFPFLAGLASALPIALSGSLAGWLAGWLARRVAA
jgi:hypothetical protein